jgi:hypothetical protein
MREERLVQEGPESTLSFLSETSVVMAAAAAGGGRGGGGGGGSGGGSGKGGEQQERKRRQISVKFRGIYQNCLTLLRGNCLTSWAAKSCSNSPLC